MGKISKLVCLALVCLAGMAPVAAPGNPQATEPPTDLPPSPLEAFAARPTAKVVWSKTIGRLESRESRATILALIVEDPTSTPSVRRGLRIDLAHNLDSNCDWNYPAWRIMCQRANAAVYVEEGRLETVRHGIERGAAELRPREYISQFRGSHVSGLIVCGYQFSDRRPQDLAALFTQAIAELNAAPR
jgi:hypothetical protein